MLHSKRKYEEESRFLGEVTMTSTRWEETLGSPHGVGRSQLMFSSGKASITRSKSESNHCCSSYLSVCVSGGQFSSILINSIQEF